MNRLRRLRSGRVGPITSSRRETFYRSRSLSLRGRISYSSWPLEGYKIKSRLEIQKCQKFKGIKMRYCREILS